MWYGDIFVRVAKFCAYLGFRVIFHTCRNIVWVFTGTYWRARWNQSLPERYGQSAQVFNIVSRFKFDVLLGPATFIDFVLTHSAFVHPEYILRDEVSLYQITNEKAIFVETPPNVDPWRCENGSFLRQAQFNFARKVITMPIHAFHKLAAKLGDPPAKLIFVQNTARCGSTLLVRIFEDTQCCVAFSEPDALNAVASYTGKAWAQDELLRVTRNTVRILCKPTKRVRDVKAYLMKMTAPSIDGVPMLADIFPDAVHFFMYRDVEKVAKSLVTITEVLPMMKAAFMVTYYHPKASQYAVSQMGLSSKDFTGKAENPLHIGTQIWMIIMKKYLQLRERGIDIKALRYEDLVDDPDFTIREILKLCSLPAELAVHALAAMQKDAQGNSALSSGNLQKKKNLDAVMTPAVAKICSDTLEEQGFPGIGQLCVVPGSIGYKKAIVWPCTTANGLVK